MRVGGWAAAKVALALIAGLTAAADDVGGDAPGPARRAGRRRRRRPRRSSASRSRPTAPRSTPRCRRRSPSIAAVAAADRRPRRTWRHEVAAIAADRRAAVAGREVRAGRRRARRRRTDRRPVEPAPGRRARRVDGRGGGGVPRRPPRWYGGWTVYATGDHFAETGEFSVVGTEVDLLGRARRLVGLLVDRDFGLAAWSPVWLLAPFGLGLLVRERPARTVDRRRRARRRLAQRHVRRPDDARLLGAGAPDRRRAPAGGARAGGRRRPIPGLADRRRRPSASPDSSTGAGWRWRRRPTGAR